MRMRHIAICDVSPLYNGFPHYLTNITLKKKIVLNTKCMFWFSKQILSETFLILGKAEWDIMGNVLQYIQYIMGNVLQYIQYIMGNVLQYTQYTMGNVLQYIRYIMGNVLQYIRYIIGNVLQYIQCIINFNKIWILWTDFEDYTYIKIHENPCSGGRFVPFRRTGR